MTIDVCNQVNVKHGQCLRPLHHEGRHFWRAEMDAILAETDENGNPLGGKEDAA